MLDFMCVRSSVCVCVRACVEQADQEGEEPEGASRGVATEKHVQ